MKQLAKKLKKLLPQKNIEDIIIFGSSVKGNRKVHDLDIALIAKQQGVEKTPFRKEIEEISRMKVHLQEVSIKDYDSFILITLLREGFSVKHEKYLHEVLRIKPVVLYTYELKPLNPSKKVMFERALKMVQGITRLSNRVVLVPIEHSGAFSDLLKYWNIDFESREYGLLPLVRKE